MDASYTTAGGFYSGSVVAGAAFGGLSAYVDDPGIEVRYNINPYLSVAGAIYARDPLYLDTSYEVPTEAAYTALGLPLNADYGFSGTGNSLELIGMFIPNLTGSVFLVNSTNDKFDGGPKNARSATVVNVRYQMGAMQFTLAYANSSREFGKGIEVAALGGEKNRWEAGHNRNVFRLCNGRSRSRYYQSGLRNEVHQERDVSRCTCCIRRK
jgi:hypothetical protein